MVSVVENELSVLAERLLKSVDLAVRELLATNADSFALANYHWVIQKNGIVLVNGERLADWAVAWTKRVLIDGQIGRRADEEVAAAALTAASLAQKNQLANLQGVVVGLSTHLRRSTSRSILPFNSPAYAAALLVGVVQCGIEHSTAVHTTDHIREVFEAAVPNGRLFGLGFVSDLLNSRDIEERRSYRDRLWPALADASLNYEDQVYVAQGLSHLLIESGSAKTLDVDIAARLELVVCRAPVWPYVFSGLEEIEPTGDSRVPVVVSHLYRAALLDVVLSLQRGAIEREESRLDTKLRGRAATATFAFIGITVSIGVPAFMFGSLLLPWLEVGRRYWIQSEFDALRPSSALLILGGVLIVIYLAVWIPMVLYSLFQLLIRSAVESDQRIIARVRSDTKRALAYWLFICTTIVLALIAEALLHTLGEL